MKYYLGVDLGGTNIAVGVVDEDYKIIGRGKVKTRCPRPAEEIVADIAAACNMALNEAGITADQAEWVGIGAPGIVDGAAGEISFASNLGFHHVPLRSMVSEATGRPAFLENDANTAAYGEVIAGGARGYHDVVAVTLGTGVGGGIIIDGKIYGGFNHAGAELGHVGMFYGGLKCACGLIGCVEMYCSASALIRQTKEKMEAHRDSRMWIYCENDLTRVDGRTAFDVMRQGDSAAREVVEQYCDYLGYALNNFVNMLQPQVILIGGGISHEGNALLDPIRAYVDGHSFVTEPEKRTRIRAATLGNDAGIIGAAFLGAM